MPGPQAGKTKSINPQDRYETVLDMINELSTIDKNLDCVYNIDTNTHSETWSIDNEKGTHTTQIKLIENNGSWSTVGKKIRKSDGKSTNVRKFNSTGHTSKEKAYKIVAKMITDIS